MQKSFWASIIIDTDDPLSSDLVSIVCEEIQGNVSRVIEVHPAPEDTYSDA